MHAHSSFVTLTYDDAHLPDVFSPCPKGHRGLDYCHFQLFMKRVRARLRARVRFYMCGEYGDLYSRPHFHACMFGASFEDAEVFRTLPSGSKIYRSDTLEALWPNGYSSIGEVTFESAAYVARYVMKKITGAKAEGHYAVVDPSTGEVVRRTPEFNRMSLRPGIGAAWLDRYSRDIYSNDGKVVSRGGHQSNPPRYYDKKMLAVDPDRVEYFQFLRSREGAERHEDNTPERLEARERVAKARLSFKKRGLPEVV